MEFVENKSYEWALKDSKLWPRPWDVRLVTHEQMFLLYRVKLTYLLLVVCCVNTVPSCPRPRAGRAQGHTTSDTETRAMKRQRFNPELDLVSDDEKKEKAEEEAQKNQAKGNMDASRWLGHCPMTPGPEVAASHAGKAEVLPIAKAPPLPKAVPPKFKAAPQVIPPPKAKALPAKAAPKGAAPVGLPCLVPEGNGAKVTVWPTGIRMLRGVHKQFSAHQANHMPGRFYPDHADVMVEFKAMLGGEEQEMVDGCHLMVIDA